MHIAVIGAGRIGAFHVRTLAALPEVTEIVVADAVPAAAEALRAELGVTVVATPEEVLASGVDGVVIAAPTATHPDLLRAAVAAGIPTLCEKPVAADVKQALALAEEIGDTDVPIQIGFPRRFDAAYVAARQDRIDGVLGYVHTVRTTTLDPSAPPEAYVRGSGGIFNDCSIHDFDAVRWATGEEVVEVYAAGSVQGVDYIAQAGDAESATTLLTLTGGVTAVVSSARTNGRGHDVRMELLGSLDSVAAGLDAHLPLRSADPAVGFPDAEPWDFFMDRFADAFVAELSAFTDVVAGRATSPCTLDDGVQASRIAEAATRSWREHRPVRLEEIR